MENAMELLNRNKKVGQRVYWINKVGAEHNGILKEWYQVWRGEKIGVADIAIIDCEDGMERSVEVTD